MKIPALSSPSSSHQEWINYANWVPFSTLPRDQGSFCYPLFTLLGWSPSFEVYFASVFFLSSILNYSSDQQRGSWLNITFLEFLLVRADIVSYVRKPRPFEHGYPSIKGRGLLAAWDVEYVRVIPRTAVSCILNPQQPSATLVISFTSCGSTFVNNVQISKCRDKMDLPNTATRVMMCVTLDSTASVAYRWSRDHCSPVECVAVGR